MPRSAQITVDPAREEAELCEYLGAEFDRERLVHWHEQVESEYRRIGDEQRLYRESQAYLYDLTAFAMSRTKEPYLRELVRALPPPARVLDYGCGIGSDGLLLLEAGYQVVFADFDNPSTRYLRWRLERRGLEAPIHDLDRDPPSGGFDLAYSFDVIEHVDDPLAFLEGLEQQARLVMVNFLETGPDDVLLHRELPVRDLLRRSARRRLLRYRVFAGRSHLVLYESGARPGRSLRSATVLAVGRVRALGGPR